MALFPWRLWSRLPLLAKLVCLQMFLGRHRLKQKRRFEQLDLTPTSCIDLVKRILAS